MAETASGKIAASDADFGTENQQQSSERCGAGGDEKKVAEAGDSGGENDGEQRPPNPSAGPQAKNPAREAKRSEVKDSKAIARDQNATCAGWGCAVHGTGMAPALRKMKLRRNAKRATARMETSQARNPQRNSRAVRRFL